LKKLIKDKTGKIYCQKEEQQEKEKEGRMLKRRIVIGRVIIYTMAILNIPFSFSLIAIGYPVFYFILQIGLSIALILGFNWTRILFGIGAIGAGLSHLNFIISRVRHGRWEGSETLMTIYFIVMIIGLVGGILLLFSKSVKDFIYYKKERNLTAKKDK